MRDDLRLALPSHTGRNLRADAVEAQPSVEVARVQLDPQVTFNDQGQTWCRPARGGKAKLLGVSLYPTEHPVNLTQREFGRSARHRQGLQSGLPGLPKAGQPAVNRPRLHLQKVSHLLGGVALQESSYGQAPACL
jgi:hypothetical protein